MDWNVPLQYLPELASGLGYTLVLCALSALFALTIGAGLALAQLRGPRWLRALASAYTTVCLGLPLLIVIYLLFYVLPNHGITLEPGVVGVAALSLYYGPYFAGVMEAAMRSLPPGQNEAAAAVGLSPWRGFRRVLLPQAFPRMLPSSTGLLIGLTKDSALLAVVSVPEFMFQARQAVSDTYAAVEIYVSIALVYWLLSTLCAALSARLEAKFTAHLSPAS